MQSLYRIKGFCEFLIYLKVAELKKKSLLQVAGIGLSHPQGVLIQMVMALQILLVLQTPILQQWMTIPLKFIPILLQMTQIRPQWTPIHRLISVLVQLSHLMYPTVVPIPTFICKYLRFINFGSKLFKDEVRPGEGG